MIDSRFKKIIRANTGCALVVAGSDSDQVRIQEIVASLRRFQIPHRVRVCSAHKQTQELLNMVDEYSSLGGSLAYVAVAGGTDALSGILSYHALGPVISCPPDAPNESCLTNPSGSSNAYIARPENVGKFIAQIYAGVNPIFKDLLERDKAQKIERLREADARFRDRYKAS